MGKQGLSLSLVEEELAELRKDRSAFGQAYDILRRRIRESLNSTRPMPPLHKWSGSRAVVGSLEMATQYIERNIEEHTEAIHQIREGMIENTDVGVPVKLGVIQGGSDEL